ncbi:MAG: hypothetical protein SOR57_07520 [Parabacteroides sp.]|nr:hypothetical protein [Parabacteroides sp.]
MRQIYYLYKHIAAVATLLLLVLTLLPSCSDDEGGGPDIPEVEYAKLVISLGSLDNARPVATKAESINDKDDNEYERYIEHWWLVVLHNNVVDQVLSDTKNNTANSVNDENNTHNVEVELQVDETYDFYAFANLPDDNQSYLNGLEKGDKFEIAKSISSIDASKYYYNEDNKQHGSYFPMSSYKYSVKVNEGASVEIPLIRLLGKISLSIQNSSNETIILKQVSLEKFRTDGEIYLLPYDAAKGEDTKLLEVTGTMQETYGPSFPGENETTITGSFTVKEMLNDSETKEISAGKKLEFPNFYVNETRFTSANSSKPLLISTDIEGRDDQPKETSFNFIRRNDWLIIPLLISDAKTTITIQQQHMPIGGIPSYVFNKGLTLSNINVTLDHAGDIDISYSVSATGATGLKYYPGGEVVITEKYCSAVLEEQTNNLLIDLPGANNDGGWQPDKIEFELNHDDSKPLEGSFKITAQELAYLGTASINLTLIVIINGSEVTLPYTITLTNGKPSNQGGN